MPEGILNGIRQTERPLNIAEVAQLLNVPVSWVYGRTRRRTLDRILGFRLGKYWRFREADVLTWIERMGTKNA
jgi:excisionase family DNA binding protein